MDSRWPEDLDVRGLSVSKSKVDALIARRKIAARRCRILSLPVHAEARSQSVAIAADAVKRNRQPVAAPAAIAEDDRTPAEHGHHHVDRAVVIQIAERSAAPSHGRIRA